MEIQNHDKARQLAIEKSVFLMTRISICLALLIATVAWTTEVNIVPVQAEENNEEPACELIILVDETTGESTGSIMICNEDNGDTYIENCYEDPARCECEFIDGNGVWPVIGGCPFDAPIGNEEAVTNDKQPPRPSESMEVLPDLAILPETNPVKGSKDLLHIDNSISEPSTSISDSLDQEQRGVEVGNNDVKPDDDGYTSDNQKLNLPKSMFDEPPILPTHNGQEQKNNQDNSESDDSSNQGEEEQDKTADRLPVVPECKAGYEFDYDQKDCVQHEEENNDDKDDDGEGGDDSDSEDDDSNRDSRGEEMDTVKDPQIIDK